MTSIFLKKKNYIHSILPRCTYSSLTQWVQQISMPPSELSALALEQLHTYLVPTYYYLVYISTGVGLKLTVVTSSEPTGPYYSYHCACM